MSRNMYQAIPPVKFILHWQRKWEFDNCCFVTNNIGKYTAVLCSKTCTTTTSESTINEYIYIYIFSLQWHFIYFHHCYLYHKIFHLLCYKFLSSRATFSFTYPDYCLIWMTSPQLLSISKGLVCNHLLCCLHHITFPHIFNESTMPHKSSLIEDELHFSNLWIYTLMQGTKD
jgi:hypothetical protein